MAADDLKTFTTQGVLGGLLLTCLLFFAISFMYYNNPTGLDDGSGEVIQTVYDDSYSNLVESEDGADKLLNITSNTNPEASDLGSRDSVSTAFGAGETSRGSYENAKSLIAWVFTGTTGKLLLGVLSTLVGLFLYFYIYKHIRQGN